MTVYYKMRQILLQNMTAILLQNTTVFLQNATVITKCDYFITKCKSYFKMRGLLQIATVKYIREITCPRFRLNRMWRLTKGMAKMKCKQ